MAGATAFVLVLSYFLLLTNGVAWGLDLVLGSIILSSVLAMGLALIVAWDRPAESDGSTESGATVS
jgi:ABC-type arginine/histidine transport system permease subunit